VALLLIPLAAIVLGVSTQCAEGGESFLFGQPVARIAVLTGRWLGSAAALCGAITLGFGIAAVVILTSAGRDGAAGYALFVAASMALAAVFLSIGAAIAVATDKRTTALGAGMFAWFFFVLLYDGIALSLAGWLTGRVGGRVLFGSILANPADLARVTMLRLAGTAEVLGASGEAWVRFLGGDAMATIVTIVTLSVWMAVPLTLAAATLGRRDL
jgi:Cu-processing system permease protein